MTWASTRIVCCTACSTSPTRPLRTASILATCAMHRTWSAKVPLALALGVVVIVVAVSVVAAALGVIVVVVVIAVGVVVVARHHCVFARLMQVLSELSSFAALIVAVVEPITIFVRRMTGSCFTIVVDCLDTVGHFLFVLLLCRSFCYFLLNC